MLSFGPKSPFLLAIGREEVVRSSKHLLPIDSTYPKLPTAREGWGMKWCAILQAEAKSVPKPSPHTSGNLEMVQLSPSSEL